MICGRHGLSPLTRTLLPPPRPAPAEESYRKQISVDDGPCLIEILDTAGQEEYAAIRDKFLRSGNGFLIVYSVIVR